MSETFILGGCPAEEDAAQLGRTPDFDRLNRLEVDCYQAALIARYGSPPPGASFARQGSTHDFGRYVELALRFDPKDQAAGAYAPVARQRQALKRDLARQSHAAPRIFPPAGRMQHRGLTPITRPSTASDRACPRQKVRCRCRLCDRHPSNGPGYRS